jgi:hypothetical protein
MSLTYFPQSRAAPHEAARRPGVLLPVIDTRRDVPFHIGSAAAMIGRDDSSLVGRPQGLRRPRALAWPDPPRAGQGAPGAGR